MCIRCTPRPVPDFSGQIGRRGPACGLFFFGILAGSGDALPKGFAFGRGQVFFRLGRARALFSGTPILPPAAGRGIQMDAVCAVLAAWLVCGATAVQLSVRLDGFHQQSGIVQGFREGGQGITHVRCPRQA